MNDTAYNGICDNIHTLVLLVLLHEYYKNMPLSQCLLVPTGGVSNCHKLTIDTDSYVDPVHVPLS